MSFTVLNGKRNMTVPLINEKVQKYLKVLISFQRPNAPKDVVADFSKMKTLEEKVRFAYELLKKSNGLVPKSAVQINHDLRNNFYAESFRATGNQFYYEKDYTNALHAYNQALCFSSKGSEIMGRAYANRSAVYFVKGFYKLCLENIELALQNGYPDELKFKLVKRKNDCLYELKQGRGNKVRTKAEPKLSYPAHPTIPFMVNGIAMKENKTFGRHLVAKQSFKPGDILMIEKPFIAKLCLENVHKYCDNCLKSNLMSLLPCADSLTTMYCSKECYEETLNGFFKYERQIVDALTAMHIAKKCICRMFFITIAVVKDFDGLKKFYDSLDVNNKNPFEIDYNNASMIDFIRSFFTLEAHQNSRSAEYDLELSIEAASMYNLIANCTDIGQLIKSKEHEDTLMKFLLRASMINSITGRSLQKVDVLKLDGSIFPSKAQCCHLMVGLINHSCNPNVCFIGDHKHALVTTRPIKAGDQLFITYCKSYSKAPKLERQSFLRSRMLFDCTCDACEKNYPHNLLRKGLNNFKIAKFINNHHIDISKTNDPKVVMTLLKMCNEFIMKNDKFAPCAEIDEIENAQTLCNILRFCEEPIELTFATSKFNHFD